MGNCCNCRTNQAAFPSTLEEKLVKETKLPSTTQVITLVLDKLDNIPVAPSLTGNTDCIVKLKIQPDDLILGEEAQKSSIIPHSTNPHWEPTEKFKFYRTTVDEKSKLLLEAAHYNPRSPDNSVTLGYAVIHFKDHELSSVPTVIKTDIITSLGKHIGQAYVKMSALTLEEEENLKEEIVYEYERWKPIINWGNDLGLNGHLLPTDPGSWCTFDGKKYGKTIDEVSENISDDWTITDDWFVEGTDRDPEGWHYAINFGSAYWYPEPNSTIYFVRRRAFTRRLRKKVI